MRRVIGVASLGARSSVSLGTFFAPDHFGRPRLRPCVSPRSVRGVPPPQRQANFGHAQEPDRRREAAKRLAFGRHILVLHPRRSRRPPVPCGLPEAVHPAVAELRARGGTPRGHRWHLRSRRVRSDGRHRTRGGLRDTGRTSNSLAEAGRHTSAGRQPATLFPSAEQGQRV